MSAILKAIFGVVAAVGVLGGILLIVISLVRSVASATAGKKAAVRKETSEKADRPIVAGWRRSGKPSEAEENRPVSGGEQQDESWQSKFCPVCGSELYIVFYGYPTEEMIEMAADDRNKIILGGCMPERQRYRCRKCGNRYTKEMMRLKNCLLTADDLIPESECRDYDRLEHMTGYNRYENRDFICETVCPFYKRHAIIKMKDGSVYHGIIRSGRPDELLLEKASSERIWIPLSGITSVSEFELI